jgi:hypothetical protein
MLIILLYHKNYKWGEKLASLAVLDATGREDIQAIIEEGLVKLPNPGVTFVGQNSIDAGAVPDIIVVSQRVGDRPPANLKGNCKILLVPGTAINLTSIIKAECVISYGMSKKDSVTLSSIGDGESVLTLQRELPTLAGKVLERQDILVRSKRKYSPDDIMAGTAALLLLGLNPEELK